jgi:hypothetical protein
MFWQKFYRMMFDLPPYGDIDEAEAETKIGFPDHRELRRVREGTQCEYSETTSSLT